LFNICIQSRDRIQCRRRHVFLIIMCIHCSCPSASLDYIVEPWFLGPGATSPGGPEFNDWADASKKSYGTVFATSIKDLPAPKEPRCALISGRTADNPRLFGECIEAGCKTIFLEKPGAPTVSFDQSACYLIRSFF
jgi:hypothetical protein